MKRGGNDWYRIKLYELTTTRNEFGEESVSYKERGTYRAQRTNLKGVLRTETDELFPDYTVEWNIPFPIQVDEGWRLQQLGGYLYTVTNVLPNVRRQLKTLICQRVNE